MNEDFIVGMTIVLVVFGVFVLLCVAAMLSRSWSEKHSNGVNREIYDVLEGIQKELGGCREQLSQMEARLTAMEEAKKSSCSNGGFPAQTE